jgi:hypothetical protein
MKVLCSHVMAFAISFSIFFYPQICYAGDIVPAGTELTEESYVFTVEEATALLKRIEDLEAKEVELEKYKDLEAIRLRQIDLYKLNLDYSEAQVNRYMELGNINQDLIDRYNKRDRLQTLENLGFLTLGIALTVGSFLAADAITDHMESTSATSISF